MRSDPLRELQEILLQPMCLGLPLTDDGASLSQMRALQRLELHGFEIKQTLLRLVTRQHGEATPAQVLICLAYRERMPTANIAYFHSNPITVPSNKQLSDWCFKHLSTKQANLWMRLDYTYTPTMAWLCLANQREIQSEIAKLNLPNNKGRVETGGRDGCQGFLLHRELFPQPPQQTQHHTSKSWLTLTWEAPDAE